LLIIAHRGNIQGPSPLENTPSQIDLCLKESIDCEVDLWVQNGIYLLGHDIGQYEVTKDWLMDRRHRLWIHCKNVEALNSLRGLNEPFLHFFWHQEDAYTITSQNYIWVYPGSLVLPGSISVLPEKWITKDRNKEISLSFGICTDYVLRFREEFVGDSKQDTI
jgi:hypothetical protein